MYENIQKQIFEARINLLLKQWPIIWGGNLVAQTLCGYVLWSHYPPIHIILWCSSNYILFLMRLYLRSQFNKQIRLGHHAVKRWAHQYAFSAVIGGLIWGSGAWLFFDASQSHLTLFLLLVFIGVTSAGLPALSSYSPAFFCFAISLILPIVIKLLTMNWDYANWLAMLSMVFLAINLFYSRNMDKTIGTSITADLKNQSLLNDMTTMRDQAEQANTQKTKFLAAVSHDLRQPLHAMGLFMSSLKTQLNNNKQQSLFANADMARDALVEMFDALLDISRLETGSVKPVIRHHSLAPIIDELISSFSVQAQQKSIKLHAKNIDHIVQTDAILLTGLLRNLLDNAVKYTDEGEILIECQVKQKALKISIQDTGCGIDSTQQQNIFAEYHQLNNPQRNRENGLGLGLSIVQKTADLLDYPLQLVSEQNKGSRFSLIVPLGDKTQIETPISNTSRKVFSHLSIMIIDDDPQVREASTQLLSDWSYTALSYASSDEAINAYQQHQQAPDLLICDYRLENNQTGLDAIADIRKVMDPQLPALIITADTHQETLRNITEKDFFVLKKPVKPAQLKMLISELLKC